MPRKQKRPEVETIRRKCVACGKIKEVKYKEWYIPPVEKETFVSGAISFVGCRKKM